MGRKEKKQEPEADEASSVIEPEAETCEDCKIGGAPEKFVEPKSVVKVPNKLVVVRK